MEEEEGRMGGVEKAGRGAQERGESRGKRDLREEGRKRVSQRMLRENRATQTGGGGCRCSLDEDSDGVVHDIEDKCKAQDTASEPEQRKAHGKRHHPCRAMGLHRGSVGRP